MRTVAARAPSRWGATRAHRSQRAPGNPESFGPRPAFDDDVVWSANPKISAVWFLGGSIDGRTRRGLDEDSRRRGHRHQAADGVRDRVHGQSGLKPERSRSIDVGIEQALAGARIAFDATGFLNHYDDLIVTVGSAFSGASRYRTDNIANASAKGLEVGLRWQTSGFGTRWPGHIWTPRCSPWTAPLRRAVPVRVGNRSSAGRSTRVPRVRSRRVARPRLRDVQGRGKTTDLEPNFASSGVRHRLRDLSVGGYDRLTTTIEVYARVTNLGDRDYEEALGYPAPAAPPL